MKSEKWNNISAGIFLRTNHSAASPSLIVLRSFIFIANISFVCNYILPFFFILLLLLLLLFIHSLAGIILAHNVPRASVPWRYRQYNGISKTTSCRRWYDGMHSQIRCKWTRIHIRRTDISFGISISIGISIGISSGIGIGIRTSRRYYARIWCS